MAGVLLALISAEAILRQIYFMPTGYDATLGSYILPGTVLYRLEGSGKSAWTLHGIRRPSPPSRSQAAVLVLGDSFTQALQVDDQDVYTHDLERLLANDGLRFQVLNAGVSGASLADYVANAPRYREWFSPTWTIVQLRVADLTREAWDSKPGFAHLDRREHGLRAEPAVIPEHSARWHRMLTWRQHSMLLSYGIIRFNEFIAANAQTPPLFRAGSVATLRQSGEATDDPNRWPIQEELSLLARAYDGRITIVFIPEFDPEHPSNYSALEAAVLEACRAEGITCLDFGLHYRTFATKHISPFGFPNSAYNFGHMNEVGHRTLASDLKVELTRLRQHGLL